MFTMSILYMYYMYIYIYIICFYIHTSFRIAHRWPWVTICSWLSFRHRDHCSVSNQFGRLYSCVGSESGTTIGQKQVTCQKGALTKSENFSTRVPGLFYPVLFSSIGLLVVSLIPHQRVGSPVKQKSVA